MDTPKGGIMPFAGPFRFPEMNSRKRTARNSGESRAVNDL